MQILPRPSQSTILENSRSLESYSPLIKRILLARGIKSDEELSFSLQQLHPVRGLASVTEAAQLLADAIEQHRQILVIGDYDADGATATALTLRALKLMGHDKIDFLIPDRFKYGYGLTPEIVELAKTYQPWLLMTVDNGVSSIEGIAAANTLGYRTLITDHHLPGITLPDCDVMVNPNRHDDTFPSKALAGVGVVFYVLLALKHELINRTYFKRHGIPEPNLTTLLDIVALGTVADVVPLDKNNRILVEQGLRRIRAGQGQAGIRALLQVAKKDYRQVVSSDFGFICGPRLNAAGRLSDMSLGVHCLLTDDDTDALQLAQVLQDLNNERKHIEATMKIEAEALIQTLIANQQNQPLPIIMCLHQPDWHEGVIGILASRIKDRYYRPVIAFASSENGLIKGSARSIAGLHVRDLIDEVASQYPKLILRFGGHALAAGLTLREQDFTHFQQAITHAVEKRLQADTFHEVIYTDGELAEEEFCLATADTLNQLAPWGQHFPEPQFTGQFTIIQLTILNATHIKALVRPILPEGLGTAVTAMDFFADFSCWPEIGATVQLVYKLNVNTFRGERHLQLLVEWVATLP